LPRENVLICSSYLVLPLLRALAEGSVPAPIHALSIELRWRDGFNLIVEFTFLHCFSGDMAGERDDVMNVEEGG
jgi:hypothetical protein